MIPNKINTRILKVVKQYNKVIALSNGKRCFDDEQVITIAITAFKEFVMKVKRGIKVRNGAIYIWDGCRIFR